MILTPLPLPGCHRVHSFLHHDPRGTFVKCFSTDVFAEAGLEMAFAEIFFSRSAPGVLRGFHLQVGEAAQHKLVAVSEGAVFDVVLDLRPGSATFLRTWSAWLRADDGDAIVLAPGVAHAFCTGDEPATLVYGVSAAHDAGRDLGVRWDSIDVAWPTPAPLVSPRDAALPTLRQFLDPGRSGG